jgi:transcriptional regulator with XRE-family HTH domain
MTKRSVSGEEQKERAKRAKEWSSFRESRGFTQKMLADTLKAIDTEKGRKCVGVSRRTIQQIEGGIISPHAHTLALFAELKSRHEAESKSGSTSKRKHVIR